MNLKLKSNAIDFYFQESTSLFKLRVHPEADTPSVSSSNTLMSPVMNVISSPSSSPSLPPMSSMLNRTISPIPSSPQSQANNNKRKSSTPSTNINRFDGTSEEELSKRVLSDILQPNLDIVFVC